MSTTETCTNCFARDREVLIRPAVKARMQQLIKLAVRHMRQLPGAGLSGDDSGLADVFEEWADQLAYEQSYAFDL